MGAFVVLVGPGKGAELSQSLSSLYENVLARHPRPVILYYGDDVPSDERNATGLLRVKLRSWVCSEGRHRFTVVWHWRWRGISVARRGVHSVAAVSIFRCAGW